MGSNPLVGVWKLLVIEFRSEGEVYYPFGREAKGVLICEPGGWSSMQIMRSGRATFVSGDPSRGTPEEVREAVEGYVAHAGPYQVDQPHGILSNEIVCSLFPNWVGTVQKRFYRLDGNRLIVGTPPLVIGSRMTDVMLIWERVS
jgi:hypothetical protein